MNAPLIDTAPATVPEPAPEPARPPDWFNELVEDIEKLAPGVVGYTREIGNALWIPLIHSQQPGRGNVGRYLDGLPHDRVVVVPSVINHVLAGMLQRRGFRPGMVQSSLGEVCDAWIRLAKGGPNDH